MDSSKWGFLRLPLELRQQIYDMCFDTCPNPSILRVNSRVHDEPIHFLRKRQQKFTYNISGKGAGFDDFSQWCFRIKRHTPKLRRIKHIVLNIHPPHPDRPIEMLHIWTYIQSFCNELAGQWRIPQLTVKFIESDGAKWATNGTPHTTMNLPYDKDERTGEDVGSILILLGRFVKNVEKPKLILPGSCIGSYNGDDPRYCWMKNSFIGMYDGDDLGQRCMETSYIGSYDGYNMGQTWTEKIEQLMTGRWKDEDIKDVYEVLEDYVDEYGPMLKTTTGRISKALFEKNYGPVVKLKQAHLDDLKRQWPHMDDLLHWERPRCRPTLDECVCHRQQDRLDDLLNRYPCQDSFDPLDWDCQRTKPTLSDCHCGKSLMEVTMPDAAVQSSTYQGARQWQEEPYDMDWDYDPNWWK